MSKIVLGIDPGANTGFAFFEDGKLRNLETGSPWDMKHVIQQSGAVRVVFEDSRLQSNVWSAVGTKAAACKIARNVGQIDAWCAYIVAVCEGLGIAAHGISPKGKGKKLDAAQFAAITGWAGPSNEHTRDGAMVAWPYRVVRNA